VQRDAGWRADYFDRLDASWTLVRLCVDPVGRLGLKYDIQMKIDVNAVNPNL